VNNTHRDTYRQCLRSVLIWCVVLLILTIISAVSAKTAKGDCNVCRNVNVQKVFHNTSIGYQYTPQVRWWVPQELRQEASSEYNFRRSESYQRLIQLEGYVEGQQSIVNALTQMQQAPQSLEITNEESGSQEFKTWVLEQARRKHPRPHPQTPESIPPPENPTPSAPDVIPTPEGTRYPIAIGRCTSCHSGTNPASGFYIEPDSTFTPDQKFLMMKKVYLGLMPLRADKVTPAPLDDDTASQFIHEMLTTE